MRSARIAALVCAALLLAACTDEVRGSASPGSPAASSEPAPSSEEPAPSPGPAPTDEQPPADPSFPADTGDDGGPAQSGAAGDPAGGTGIDGLRLTNQNGYTRLVVDLEGAGVPEWTVAYSQASGPGGGPVEISGDAFLRVSLRTGGSSDDGSTIRLRTSPGPIVEAVTTGSFEGSEEILVGVQAGEQPFRAFALTDPGRIVIDVRAG